MDVTAHVTDADLRPAEVEKLVNSRTLHGSESLCKLLRYLVDHAVKHPGAALKEYQIATEVFARPAGFDPHMDSLVRVQAGRLRSKLAEYYASEGVDDPVIIDLPKGTYSPTFTNRSASTKTILHESPARPTQDESHSPGSRFSPLVVALLVMLGASLLVIAFLVERNSAVTAKSDQTPVPSSLSAFWHEFLVVPEEPWVIFSNGAFVGRPETGLRYYNPARDSKQTILDHYTGVGEVLAVSSLNHLFTELHKQIRVKRGSLFTLDDAQNNNLIFVGSPAENLTLRDIPNTHEFVFQRLTEGPRKGDLALVNLRPQPDEPKQFLATPSGTPLTEDYAVVGLVRGLNPEKWVLILAGTTTIGTQAAAEYVCRPESLQQLMLRLSLSENGTVKPFEAVLRVKVTRGVPISTELVALRMDSSVR